MGSKKIFLQLQDGSLFEGYSFGSETDIDGEVVFNTSMVGYPEMLTDPSYRGQILVLSYPLIGNYGVPSDQIKYDLKEYLESDTIHISGLIITDYSHIHNHWASTKSLSEWLKKHNIPAIYGIDTRAVIKKLRHEGVMLGKIRTNPDNSEIQDPNKRNLVSEVSCKEKIIYGSGKTKILLVDVGVKNNIIRNFLKRDCTVIRVPYNYDFTTEEYDALFISNGPGDPKMCTETIQNLKKALSYSKPIFGICLGNQLLSLAAGADTYKLKYGHRSSNQPCLDHETNRCYITSQNHGYAVNNSTIPKDYKVWFTNANDNTNEGIKHAAKPIFSVQFHPEASAGPTDTEFLFDQFLDEVRKLK